MRRVDPAVWRALVLSMYSQALPVSVLYSEAELRQHWRWYKAAVAAGRFPDIDTSE